MTEHGRYDASRRATESPVVVNRSANTDLVVEFKGFRYRYTPQPAMTGYQAGLVAKLFAFGACGWLSTDFDALWQEIYSLTAEHWTLVE